MKDRKHIATKSAKNEEQKTQRRNPQGKNKNHIKNSSLTSY